MKYCLYEESGPKKQDYKDRFRSRLFSLEAVSQILKILYWVTLLYKLKDTDRSKAVLLLWFLTVTCSCCPHLFFGSPIMWVTYFS